MILSWLLTVFAHADYFSIERQIQVEESQQRRAVAEANMRQEIAQHNQRLGDFVASVGQRPGRRGVFNLVAQPCTGDCWAWDAASRSPDWINRYTFDTGDGFACYAEVFPAGHELRCRNPQTRERIDEFDVSRRRVEKPAKRHERR